MTLPLTSPSSSSPVLPRIFATGLLLLLAPACSSQLPHDVDGGGAGGRGGDGMGATGGAGLGGSRDGGQDAICSPSGAACDVSGCCQAIYEMCLPQGAGRVCAHADLPPTYGAACNGPASSTLPGVSLVFPDDRCSYTQAEAAAGITIKYQVVVDQNLDGVHPTPTDAGRCQQPGAGGVIVGFRLEGGGASYCLCDTGLCPSQPFTTAPRAGRYDVEIPWDGRQWGGPSDTSNPKGPPFSPGTYTLTLSSSGTRANAAGIPADGGGPAGDLPYAVTAIRHITITP